MATTISSTMSSNIVWLSLKARLLFLLWLLLASDFRIAVTTSSQNSIKYNTFVRCTRRYTPGMCHDTVEPVWTFVFQQQNCTERLGCPSEWRVNRFKTYSKCMRRCQPLVDMYTQFLIKDEDNLSDFYLRSRIFGASGRRDIDYYDNLDNYEEYPGKVVKHIEGPPPDPMEDETDRNHHQYTIDIDYVEREDNEQDADDEK